MSTAGESVGRSVQRYISRMVTRAGAAAALKKKEARKPRVELSPEQKQGFIDYGMSRKLTAKQLYKYMETQVQVPSLRCVRRWYHAGKNSPVHTRERKLLLYLTLALYRTQFNCIFLFIFYLPTSVPVGKLAC